MDPRPLPHSVDHEKSILSYFLKDSAVDYLEQAEEKGLSKEHFYVPAHGLIYDLLQEFRRKERSINLIDFTQELKDRGMLDNVGGRGDIFAIQNSWEAGLFEGHLATILAKHLQRQVISVCTSVIRSTYESSPSDASQGLQDALSGLAALQEGQDSGKDILSARQVLTLCYEDLEKRILGKNTSVIETPWANLNDLLGGGLGVGEITVVAARPSRGKTAFAMNLVEFSALRDIPSFVASIESREMKLGFRMASQNSGLDLKRLSKERPTKGDLEKFTQMTRRCADKPWFIRKLHYARHGDVTSSIRSAVRNHGVKLVVVDYLQLIKASTSSEQNDVRLRMDNALDAICPLAAQLDIALVILVQLNREAEGIKGDKLNLSMLKETSRIEQDADLVIMLGEAFNHEGDKDKALDPCVAMVPKNRDGPTSYARLLFHGPTTKFY